MAEDGNDPFGRRIIHDILRDNSLCRRLRPGFFLDGVGVPCTMFPHAQLCDVCKAQSIGRPADEGLHPIPDHLAPALPSRGLNSDAVQRKSIPDPLKKPAPLATFTNHLAAANACVALGKVRFTDTDLGGSIREACDNLAKSCVNCWCNGLEYHSHTLAECRWRPANLRDESCKKWVSTLRLPIGCCFFCGCPLKVRQLSIQFSRYLMFL